MNDLDLHEFIHLREQRNKELWDAYYAARKHSDELMKKWHEARDRQNKPIEEYLTRKHQ